MMRDDDLVELFQALDNGGPADSPAYADDLWAELDQALEGQQSSSEKPPTADADIIELVQRPDRRTTRFPMRGLVGMAALLIVGLLLTLALPLDQADDVATEGGQPPSPTTTANPSPTTTASPASSAVPIPGPRLTVPSEACQRYAAREPTFEDLQERAADESVTPEDVEAATTALSMLRADLAASGEYTEGDIRSIDFALEALREVSIEIEMGLYEQAAGSLSAASTVVDDLLLPSDTGVGVAVRCVGG